MILKLVARNYFWEVFYCCLLFYHFQGFSQEESNWTFFYIKIRLHVHGMIQMSAIIRETPFWTFSLYCCVNIVVRNPVSTFTKWMRHLLLWINSSMDPWERGQNNIRTVWNDCLEYINRKILIYRANIYRLIV